MSSKLKTAIGLAIAAIIAVLVLFAQENGIPLPGQVPTPSPTSNPTPGGPVMLGMINEAQVIEIEPPAAAEIPQIDGLRLEAFEILQVTTTRPSFAGARVGLWDDPLVPVPRLRAGKRYWIDLTPTRAGTFSGVVGGRAFTVHAMNRVMPRNPIHPMFAELQFDRIRAAHRIADEGPTMVARCALAAKYRALMRAHRIEPIKSWHTGTYPPVAGGEMNLDAWPYVGCSFRAQVLDGAITDRPMLWGPDPKAPPSPALLAAVKRARDAGRIPPDSRAYVWDEGELDPALSRQALDRAQGAKPFLPTFITRRPDALFDPFVSTFCVVQDWLEPDMRVGCTYPSCMAHGCGNGIATGTPLSVIDAPRVHARAAVWVSWQAGASETLYFALTVSLPTAWDPDGQFNAGDGKGNGDGTALYPGRAGEHGLETDQPIASIRLKQWRRGLYDIEYLEAARREGIDAPPLPVRGPRDWSKSEAEYDAVIRAVAEKLEGTES